MASITKIAYLSLLLLITAYVPIKQPLKSHEHFSIHDTAVSLLQEWERHKSPLRVLQGSLFFEREDDERSAVEKKMKPVEVRNISCFSLL